MDTLVATADNASGRKNTGQGATGRVGLRRSRHLLAIAVIVGASLLLFYLHFSQHGYLMHADMTWPLTVARIRHVTFNTWFEFGSAMNVHNIQRILWSTPFLAVAQLLKLSGSQYLMLLFVSTFSLAGISMYALAYNVISSMIPDGASEYLVTGGALLGALVYMYNPWSMSHLWSFWMYPAYALMPLIFLVLTKVMERPTLRNTIVLGLLVSVCSTAPMDVIWPWFLIFSYAIFRLVASRFSWESLKKTAKAAVLTGAVYLLVNALWVVPYVYAILVNKPMVATYSTPVSQAMIDGLSASNTIVNNLRLVSGWGYPVSLVPSGTLPIFLSFALPIAAVTCLVIMRDFIKRNSVINYWTIMFVISVLLATGTTFILRKPYSYAVLGAPGSSSFGWIFRAADRWLAFVPTFYALMVGILWVKFLSAGSRLSAGKVARGKVIDEP